MPTRLGLIGHGKWGRNIERTLLSLPDVSVVVIGRNQPVRRELDGILIASPSSTHAELALPYIEAGIATFIEKPMATSVACARRIQDAANRSRAPIFVGHLHLYNPAFLALLELLPSLGAVRYVLSVSANGNPRTDCSVLWDWLPHDLSMAWSILGRNPLCVQAWNLTEPQNAEAAISRFLYNGASWVSTISWLSPVPCRRTTIAAEHGLLIFDDRAEQKLVVHGAAGAICYPTYGAELPLANELRTFLDIVRGGSVDSSHVALGLAVTEAIAAAHESMAAGGVAVKIQK